MSNGGGGGNGYPLAINVVISATRHKLVKEMTVLYLELALTGTMPGTKECVPVVMCGSRPSRIDVVYLLTLYAVNPVL